MCECHSYHSTDSEPTRNGLLQITALQLSRVQLSTSATGSQRGRKTCVLNSRSQRSLGNCPLAPLSALPVDSGQMDTESFSVAYDSSRVRREVNSNSDHCLVSRGFSSPPGRESRLSGSSPSTFDKSASLKLCQFHSLLTLQKQNWEMAVRAAVVFYSE